MSSKTATLVGGIIAILLLIEVIGNLIQSNREIEEKNPIDSNGRIKDGYTISFEEEEKMAIESFPEISEEEYTEQLLYAISQCILTSVTLNSYECIGNNIADSYFEKEQSNFTNNEKGKFLYSELVKGLTPTGVNTEILDTDSQIYQLEISVLEARDPLYYVLQIEDRKIISITERED